MGFPASSTSDFLFAMKCKYISSINKEAVFTTHDYHEAGDSMNSLCNVCTEPDSRLVGGGWRAYFGGDKYTDSKGQWRSVEVSDVLWRLVEVSGDL